MIRCIHLKRNENGSIIIGLKVQHNFELEREILGFGNSVVVLSPQSLRIKISQIIQKQVDSYKETYM
jgi:predicted DNA-binding transcriptional regulator YafY